MVALGKIQLQTAFLFEDFKLQKMFQMKTENELFLKVAGEIFWRHRDNLKQNMIF